MYYDLYKKIVDIDKNPWCVQFMQTWTGKSIALLLFTLPFIFPNLSLMTGWKFLMIIIMLVTFIPNYRRLWLLLGVLIIALRGKLFIEWYDWHIIMHHYSHQVNSYKLFPGFFIEPFKVISIGLVFVFSAFVISITSRFKHYSWVQRHVLNLYTIILVLILLVEYISFSLTVKIYLWSFIIVFGHYFWFIAYTLHDIKVLHGSDFVYEYGRYHPIWGSTNLPFPKGPSYLKLIESKTSEDFAMTQLKGLKLLWWAWFLYLLQLFFIGPDNLHVPTLIQALLDYEKGLYYPWYRAWQCLLLNFFNTMINLTVVGHTIIASCRMCGYRALRNTYKPLQSTTIAEFWNRYYYYFKELLVDLFFYPTYFTFFKTKPKLRIFFATLAAATFGNAVYHFLAILDVVNAVGLIAALKTYEVYLLYTLILGLAIGFSQLRNLNRIKKPRSALRQGLSVICVLSFYIFVSIFSARLSSPGIMIHVTFLTSLFNV